jgi:1-acyl-sn-glycerol-3-phosphate acyltransferase
VSVIIRSVVFNILFYLVILLYVVAMVPTLLLPYRYLLALGKHWGRTNLWLLRVICGVKAEFRGLEKIPPGGLIVASKHQSVWETFALAPHFDSFTFILKRELMWIPFFGWYLWKGRMIPVNRGARGPALAAMTERAKDEVQHGRQIIIFPEGTRRPPGAEPQYKFGVAHLYEKLGVPCLPVALNSGLFWPRRSFRRFPGTVVVQICDPIAPGLEKSEFFARLQETLESASAKLLEEGKLTARAESRARP